MIVLKKKVFLIVVLLKPFSREAIVHQELINGSLGNWEHICAATIL